MLLVSLRDLQWRRRRFLIAIAATALVFALTLLMAGVTRGLHAEIDDVVGAVHADRWLVARGGSGPFTTATAVPDALAEVLERDRGVESAEPIVIARTTIRRGQLRDVNLLGFEPGGLLRPRLRDGRLPRRAGEVVVDDTLGMEVGDELVLGGREFEVVGESTRMTYFFAIPTVLVRLPDAQAIVYNGAELATTVVTEGVPRRVPATLQGFESEQVAADLDRPLANGVQTIEFVSVLLWIVAAGIIGSIVYLSALERMRDFAVMKATGVSSRTLLTGLVLQAVVLSLASAVTSVGVAYALRPGFPFRVEVDVDQIVSLVVVAVLVGVAASVAGLRRSVKVDPATAFGAA